MGPASSHRSKMQVFRTARIAKLLPAAALKPTCSFAPLSATIPRTVPMMKREAGTGVIAAGLAITGVGTSTVGVGLIFGGLVQAMARNPSMKEDLFTYALIGIGMVEFFAIIVALIAGLLLYSE